MLKYVHQYEETWSIGRKRIEIVPTWNRASARNQHLLTESKTKYENSQNERRNCPLSSVPVCIVVWCISKLGVSEPAVLGLFPVPFSKGWVQRSLSRPSPSIVSFLASSTSRLILLLSCSLLLVAFVFFIYGTTKTKARIVTEWGIRFGWRIEIRI